MPYSAMLKAWSLLNYNLIDRVEIEKKSADRTRNSIIIFLCFEWIEFKVTTLFFFFKFVSCKSTMNNKQVRF